jgi:aminoglycoside phosphotransferase (APT) family kinase protein
MAAACAAAQFPTDDASLMRLGENALFHLPRAQAVVRIARSMDYWADAVKEVNVSHWLAGYDFPAVEVCETGQPIEIEGHPVTFWKYIDGRPGDTSDVATLGHTLRQLHAMPEPTDFKLPPKDALGRIRPRIANSPIPESDRKFLLNRLDNLAADLPRLEYKLDPSPTHGDAHVKNLMIRSGAPILIDFERFAYGQPEWDLAVTATEYSTAKWWSDEQYRNFVDAYGYDVTAWDGFATLRAVNELSMTTWLMQNVAESPEIADEYQTRMRTLRGEKSPGWKPF